MAGKASIIVIIGPTASGKSALAFHLARQLGADILSVDSMQVYRHMDIGTAKPTVHERREVRHHLIDVADPDESFAVARFVEMADRVIADARARNVPLLATGGTPLYFKSLFEGLFDGPGADAGLRQRLHEQSPQDLHDRLKAIDPAAAGRIHVNDRKRLVRAVEVFELTGRPISSFQTEWASGVRRHQALWFGLNWERDALNRRINARVKQMIDQGWLAETRGLIDRYGELSRTASEATGYHELIEHLQGRLSLVESVERIKIATRQLARRQMKWFRRFQQVNWLSGDRPVEELSELVVGKVDAGE